MHGFLLSDQVPYSPAFPAIEDCVPSNCESKKTCPLSSCFCWVLVHSYEKMNAIPSPFLLSETFT